MHPCIHAASPEERKSNERCDDVPFYPEMDERKNSGNKSNAAGAPFEQTVDEAASQIVVNLIRNSIGIKFIECRKIELWSYRGEIESQQVQYEWETRCKKYEKYGFLPIV
jgi:hypothetical protein